MDRVLLLGPPGAGKGTQARLLAERGNWTLVSSGDLLRSAIAAGTDLGIQARVFVEDGELVPDDLMITFVVRRVAELEPPRFILDGFPRTLVQARSLDAALAKDGTPLEVVVHFVVDHAVIVERIAERRSCPDCGRTFHLTSDPPKIDGICDVCGAALVLRKDDSPDIVEHRLELYRTDTEPLIGYYRDLGILLDVDGLGEPAQVAKRIEAAFDEQ